MDRSRAVSNRRLQIAGRRVGRLSSPTKLCLKLIPLAHYVVAIVFAATLLSGVAAAQPGPVPNPVGGTPAGAYDLSQFENINLYSGKLDFRLPLLGLKGRGGDGFTVSTQITYNQLRIEKTGRFVGNISHNYYYAERSNTAALEYSPGIMASSSWVGRGMTCFASNGVDYYIGNEISVWYTFTMPDGSSIELRDAVYDGQPLPPAGCNHFEPIRTKIYKSRDGSGITYISGTNSDGSPSGVGTTGILLFADGTKYILTGGHVDSITDHNGNTTTFTYEPFTDKYPTGGTYTNYRVKTITDSVGRIATIVRDVAEGGQYGTCDQIKYTGFDQLDLIVRVCKSDLGDALGENFSLLTHQQLFPALFLNSNEHYEAGLFNPKVVSSVWLPNGRRYQFLYNSYSDLIRVEAPTGAVTEYDWEAGLRNLPVTGFYSHSDSYRRVVQRRRYTDGVTLISKTNFSKPDAGYRPSYSTGWYRFSNSVGYADVDYLDFTDNDKILSRERHYFYNSAAFDRGLNEVFEPWVSGKEWKCEYFGAGGTKLLLTVEKHWQQASRASWWNTSWWGVTDTSRDAPRGPSSNPRIVEIVTRYADSGQTTRQTALKPTTQEASFDQFNNRTESWEYDYTDGQTQEKLLRHTRTEYVDAPEYIGDSTAGGAHLRRLVKRRQVFAIDPANGNETLAAQVDYSYDEAAYPVLTYDQVTGWNDPHPGNARRGNLTTIKSWLNTKNTSVETHAQYDQCGNLRKGWAAHEEAAHQEVVVTHPRVTEIDYTDSYADAPHDRHTYAYATATTSVVPNYDGVHGAAIGATTASVYDYYSGLVTSTTSNGQQTDFSYLRPDGTVDPLQRLYKVTRPDDGWTSYEYGDEPGNIFLRTRSSIDADRASDAYRFYDGLGRPTRIFAYNGGNNAAELWTATKVEYDIQGRPWKTSNPQFRSSLADFDPPANSLTVTTYDDLDRPVIVKAPDGAIVRTDYSGDRMMATDQLGRKRMSRVDALGHLTDVWEIKGADSPSDPVVQVSLPGRPEVYTGYHTSYAYDALGNLVKTEQGVQRRYFAYDSLSRLIRVKHPEQEASASMALPAALVAQLPDQYNSWAIALEYDQYGGLESSVDARGVKASFTYDNLGRPTGRSYSLVGAAPADYVAAPSAEFFYDGKGLPSVPENSLGALTMAKAGDCISRYTSFDIYGRVTASEQSIDGQTYGGMEYGYNLAGALVSQKYPSGRVVTETTDDVGRFSKLTGQLGGGADVTYADSVKYAAHGAVSALRLGNDLWEQTAYDPKRLQATQIRLGDLAGSNDILKLDYDYGTAANNDGNVKKLTFTATGLAAPIVQTYDYDALNRLRSAEETVNDVRQWVQTFTHDRYGNRSVDTSMENNQPKTTPAFVGFNPQVRESDNRIERRAGSNEQYDYDKVGNLTRDADGNRLVYDGENRQVQYFAASDLMSPAVTYVHDAEGRRVKRVAGNETTVFVYDAAGKMVAEYTNVAPTGAGRRFVTADLLGSPRVVTDMNKEVKERHDYLPYGEEVPTTYGGRSALAGYGYDLLRQKFTGYDRDALTKLDFAQARYYSSPGGRFTSVDPALSSAHLSNPQTLNRYAYCGNNPVNNTDPAGLDWYWNTAEEGSVYHPTWFNDNPGGTWQPMTYFIYLNVETGKWTTLNPYKNEARDSDSKEKAWQVAWEFFLAHEMGDVGEGPAGGGGDEWGEEGGTGNQRVPLPSKDTVTMITGILAGALDPTSLSDYAFSYAGLDTEGSLWKNSRAIGTGLTLGATLGARAAFKGGVETLSILNCFVAGTPVWTSEGLKPIEEIEAGEEVLSWNQVTQELEFKPVLKTTRNRAEELVTIAVDGEPEPINTTPGHPFYVRGDGTGAGGWMLAGFLRRGDQVRSPSGAWVNVREVERHPRAADVFNFEVADNHDYFVGSGGMLVHNDSLGAVEHIARTALTPIEVASKKGVERIMPSISKEGIKEPIKYFEENGVKYVVDGHHRLAAAWKLGLEKVPVQRVPTLPFPGIGVKSAAELLPVEVQVFLRNTRWIK